MVSTSPAKKRKAESAGGGGGPPIPPAGNDAVVLPPGLSPEDLARLIDRRVADAVEARTAELERRVDDLRRGTRACSSSARAWRGASVSCGRTGRAPTGAGATTRGWGTAGTIREARRRKNMAPGRLGEDRPALVCIGIQNLRILSTWEIDGKMPDARDLS
ncbi:hypothetical protein THAOC_36918 [Thalassiosira oceanica]|uniref:Uncharacterized protein n=1 Tax=Thalassiosira oceanica TaxID=159749 RepID=K0RDA8_THAOC|nr:hypothetical protein THAOC_36918 [Thalassiosira oceanica]|eukprot:EJK44532.1 hypothetical protein THAOC_36918 [Thalassiosira oceanica]